MQECGCGVDKKSVLYCASQSAARHALLQQAEIAFKVIPIDVCEEDAEVEGSVQEQVMKLAQYKHIGINVPAIIEAHEESKAPIYLLTADTLIAGLTDGVIYGKPQDRGDAAQMIKAISRQDIVVATGMCFSVWLYHPEEEGWYNPVFETWSVDAKAEFFVPDDEIEHYFDRCPMALKGCGATAVDGVGITYFKSLHGSYTGALGLDMFSLRQLLKKHGFSF